MVLFCVLLATRSYDATALAVFMIVFLATWFVCVMAAKKAVTRTIVKLVSYDIEAIQDTTIYVDDI